jgi:glycosyltransferase involved in cell wall biosynthesis
MRVLLLVTDLQRGGTPLRIARLARGLRAAGVEVTVGCLGLPGPVSGDLEAAGIPTFACLAENVRDWAALRRLSRHVRAVRPDIIHGTLLHANVAARLMGLWHRIPVVSSTATIEVERRWHRWLELATGRMDRGHIVGSVSVAEHVVRAFWLPRRHVRIVPPSLDPWPRQIPRAEARAALGALDSEFVVAWVGRFDRVKRLDLLIRCAEIMTAVPARFVLVGDGPERVAVEQMLRLSNAARIVHLLGWRTEVGPVLSAADAFLFPSLTEGMPNAVLEALACGVPVVGADLPVLRELGGNGERIRLVRGNEPREYAEALMKLREDEAGRLALGRRGAEWARAHLDPAATVAATLRVYRAILRRKRTGS